MIHLLDRGQSARICPISPPLGPALLRQYAAPADGRTNWLFIDAGTDHQDFEAVIYVV